MISTLSQDLEFRKRRWTDYLLARTGTYEMRCDRYRAVAMELLQLGLSDDDLLVDVGAGWTEFDYFLRTELHWRGRYHAIDGSIDGVDLNTWLPMTSADFFVSIEVLEHLTQPGVLLDAMERLANKGIVITTPNPAVVDVLAIDETHCTPLPHDFFIARGWRALPAQCFGRPNDTIIAAFSRSMRAIGGEIDSAADLAMREFIGELRTRKYEADFSLDKDQIRRCRTQGGPF